MGAPPSPAALRAHDLAQSLGRPTY
ncbi:MAG: hypothetical protein RIT28_2767, partial [Pseudomonadota bacterium]